jgi:hypothetical protein
MTSQIDDAVAAAEAAAANMTDTQVAVAPAQGTALAPAAAGGAVDMSLGSFLTAGGINPDKWLQVKDTGLKLDKNDKATFDEFTGEVDFARVKMFVGLRISLPGNKYEYIKSYDGRTEAKTGQNWNVAVAEANARAAAPSTTYRGADILLTLDKDVKQGNATIPAGMKVGYTTSITGFAPFQSLLQTLVESGDITVGAGDRLSGVVTLKLTHEAKKNADYEWGIVNFEKA